jgi:alkylated DNA repair protein alkB family protein 6
MAGEEVNAGSSWLEQFRVGSLPTIYYVPEFVSVAEQGSLVHQVNSAPVAKWKSLKNRRLQNWGGVVHAKGLISQPVPGWIKTVTEKITKETKLYPAPINHVLVNEYLPGQGISPHQDGPVYYPVVAILSLGSPTLMHFTPHVRLLENNQCGQVDSQKTQDSSTQGTDGQQSKATCSVALMPGSLLLFKDTAYTDHLHGIEEAYEDILDDKVVNKDAYLAYLKRNTAGEGAVAKDWPSGDELLNLKHYERHSGILRRTGTRLSLTCRLVPRVHKNLLRL